MINKRFDNKLNILNGPKYFYSGTLQNISIQEYYKIILHLYQLRNKLNVLVALLGFTCRNLMECQKKILKI